MEQISNVLTLADYADSLTLGPSNYEAIAVNVWNNSCVAQVYGLGNSGDYQTGNWSSESLEAANSTFTLARCGGVRFKDNPATPGSNARIVAYAWKDGDVQKFGGIQLAGVLGPSGSVTMSAVITGIISSTGAIAAGTGFTVVKGGAGVYTIVLNTAFSSTPVVGAIISDGSASGVVLSAANNGQFTLNTFTTTTGAGADHGFEFTAQAVI